MNRCLCSFSFPSKLRRVDSRQVESESQRVVERGAITLCSGKAAAKAGGIRYALDICRRAVELVEAEVRKQQILKVTTGVWDSSKASQWWTLFQLPKHEHDLHYFSFIRLQQSLQRFVQEPWQGATSCHEESHSSPHRPGRRRGGRTEIAFRSESETRCEKYRKVFPVVHKSRVVIKETG